MNNLQRFGLCDYYVVGFYAPEPEHYYIVENSPAVYRPFLSHLTDDGDCRPDIGELWSKPAIEVELPFDIRVALPLRFEVQND